MNAAEGGGRTCSVWRSATVRFAVFLVVTQLLALSSFVAFSLYERAVLGDRRLGVGTEPLFTGYYNGRFVFAFLLALLMIVGLYRLRDSDAYINGNRLSDGNGLMVWGGLIAASVCVALFVVDPVLFYEISLEDRALEWASALLPLAGSLLFLVALTRIRKTERREGRGISLGLCALFALGFFVMGMEEISWMQRVFRIETPALFASNQQHEMNLHNMHSIVIGSVHKLGVYVFLILLPFVVDTAPRIRALDIVYDFIPSRFVLAASAPIAAFHYNEWNFFPTPLTVLMTLTILGCYMTAAAQRRDRREFALFGAVAAFILVAQPLFLMLGAGFVRSWDASEYMELFMAIGLLLFAWEAVIRLGARYGAARTAPLSRDFAPLSNRGI